MPVGSHCPTVHPGSCRAVRTDCSAVTTAIAAAWNQRRAGPPAVVCTPSALAWRHDALAQGWAVALPVYANVARRICACIAARAALTDVPRVRRTDVLAGSRTGRSSCSRRCSVGYWCEAAVGSRRIAGRALGQTFVAASLQPPDQVASPQSSLWRAPERFALVDGAPELILDLRRMNRGVRHCTMAEKVAGCRAARPAAGGCGARMCSPTQKGRLAPDQTAGLNAELVAKIGDIAAAPGRPGCGST
jgi:hypothetical protein